MGSQSQSRSEPCWLTRLTVLTWVLRSGSDLPSALMMGAAGWLAKPDRRHVMAKTRSEIAEKVRALERDRDNGTMRKAGPKWTVATWLSFWIENVAVPPHVAENTHATPGCMTPGIRPRPSCLPCASRRLPSCR